MIIVLFFLDLQRAADSTREMAAMRQRHLDQMRAELEAVKGKLRTAEEEGTRMRALISHNNHQARGDAEACRARSWRRCCAWQALTCVAAAMGRATALARFLVTACQGPGKA